LVDDKATFERVRNGGIIQSLCEQETNTIYEFE